MNLTKALIFASLVGTASGGTTATWTTYSDETCTTLCPLGGSACDTTVDTSKACNQNSESSQSNVVCLADKITYTNFPNTGTTSGSEGCPDGETSFPNEIAIGECVYFPGPVSTWKKIEADTYDCEGGSGSDTDTDDDESDEDSAGPTAMTLLAFASLMFPFLMTV